LRRGVFRLREQRAAPSLVAFSRIDPASGEEFLVAVNFSNQPIDASLEVEIGSRAWHGLHGQCAATAAFAGSYPVSVPPLDFVICRNENPL